MKDERGIALVVVLMVIALLSIVTVQFGFSAQVYTHMARNSLSGLQANLLARSGVNLGQAVLAFDEEHAVDAFSEEWCPEPTESSCQVDVSALFPLPENMLLRVEIRDESGKFNLNLTRPSPPEYQQKLQDPTTVLKYEKYRVIFDRLLEGSGVEIEAAQRLYDYWDQAIEDAISGGNDSDDVEDPNDGDGDGDDRQAGNLPLNRLFQGIRFETLDDANVALGLHPRELAELRKVVTAVRGSQRINVNTAPREVLMAIVEDEGIADDIITRRLDLPLQRGDIATLIPTEGLLPGELNPTQLLGVQSKLYMIHASGVVNPNPITGRGGIGRSASLLVRRNRKHTGDERAAWTFTPLDWQKEGGARLFEEDGEESSFGRDDDRFL